MNTAERNTPEREPWRDGSRERDAALADALREIVLDLDAEASAVYLRVPGVPCLDAAAMAVTPMGVGAVERIALGDEAFPSAQAYATGELATANSSQILGAQPDLSAFAPYSYVIVSAPLTAGGRRFGTLSTYWLRAEMHIGEGVRGYLAERAATIGARLLRIADAGGSLVPPSVPRVVVGAREENPRATAAPFVYHLHKLAVLLASAETTSDVVDLALERLVRGFGARAALLALVRAERLHVAGASGCADPYVQSLRGAALTSELPEARAAATARHVAYGPAAPETAGRCAGGADDDVTWLVLPLVAAGRPIGTCSMAFGPERRAVTAEPTVTAALSSTLGQALDRTRLHDARHALAESLQDALLPRVLPQLAGVISTSRYLPASTGIEVGGDWYDLIDLPDGGVTMVIGDVQGHNTAAVVVMGQLRSVVRAYAAEGHGPAAVLARTNRLLVRLGTDLFATCCCVTLDPDTGVARAATAGHAVPLVRTAAEGYREVDVEPGLPLGIDEGAEFPETELLLPSGTLLAFSTDGLVPGGGTLTRARLEAALTGGEGELERVADLLVAEAGGPAVRRGDDAALQLVCYQGPSAAAQTNVRQLEIHRRDLLGARRARELLRGWLADWELSALTEEAELMLSEVVTNGLVHGDSDVFLCVRRYAGLVRVEVRDSDPRPACAVSAPGTEDEAEGGRGLLIVSALAAAWGNSPGGRGKTVWFELSVPALPVSAVSLLRFP